jgi:hypothetical protein
MLSAFNLSVVMLGVTSLLMLNFIMMSVVAHCLEPGLATNIRICCMRLPRTNIIDRHLPQSRNDIK